MSLKSIKKQTTGDKTFAAATAPLAPIVSSYTVNGIDDTALDPAGGQTVLINGTGFKPGATITLSGTAVSIVSYVSTNQLSFTSPAKSAGTYTIYVTNTDGGTGIYAPGIVYSTFPTWSTASGSIGSYYETQNISNTFVATSDSAIANYTVVSGALPSGATLYANGVLSGTAPADSGSTTYNFTIQATDTELQDSTRSFSLTINTDTITWSSPANASVVTSYEYSNISNVTLTASSAVGGNAITYTANSFPTGISLSGNTISGMSNTIANTATLLTATGNATGRNATRTVYFDVQQDVVTWSSPADGTTYTASGSAISNVTLAATSAAGKDITFSANTLPTGVTLNANVISGTPTVGGNTTTLLTATAATTNRNATRTIYWVVSLGDSYWKNVSLLLNGTTPTTTFINDASLNNNQLTIAGDTRPSNFDPYMAGYYSNYFDGTGDYLSIAGSSQFICTGDFTISCWLYPTSMAAVSEVFGQYYTGGTAEDQWLVEINTNGSMVIYCNGPGSNRISVVSGTIVTNKWQYLSIVRSGSTVTVYVNGTSVGSTTKTTTWGISTNALIIGAYYSPVAAFFTGYISNFRYVNGTAITGVPTGPLTAVENTVLLTCQSNRIIDNSKNNFTVTKNGDTTVSSANPFTTPTTAAYNTLYSTYFDGTGDYLTTPTSITNLVNFPSGTDYTIECWVYPTVAVTYQDILGSYSGPTSGRWLLVTAADGLTPRLYVYPTGDWQFTAGSGSMTLNTWNHIAIVRIGSTTKGYLNGVERLSTTTVMTLDGGSNSLYIGAGYSGRTPWNGNISNVRIVKGLGVYTGAFTVPTTSLTATQSSGTNIAAITGTSTTLLTCQNATFIDNSTNAYAITSAGDAKPIAVSPFTMTTSNTTVTSLGSAYFDGSGDILTYAVNDSNLTNWYSQSTTIEAWIYPTSSVTYTNNYPSVVNNGATGSSTCYWAFGINGLNLRFAYFNGAGQSVQSTGTIPLNAWTHIAFVYNNSDSSIKLYINGVLDGSSTKSGTPQSDSTLGLLTGSWNGGSFAGYISDLRIIKGTALYTSNFVPPQAPLTPVANTQLLTLQYNGGATNNGFVDQSSFNNIITRNGNATQGTFSPYSQAGWSNYFDGTGDYLTLTNTTNSADASEDCTFECWFMLTSAQTSGNAWKMFTGQSTGAGAYWGLTNAGVIEWQTGSSYGSWTFTASINVWYHIATVRVGTSVKTYINGTQIGTAATISAAMPGVQAVGVGYSTSYAFPGYISNLRVVKGTAVYTSNFTPPTTPLSAITGTQLLTCQSNRFVDNSINNFTITRNGDTKVQAFSPFGGVTSVPTSYSVYFDGSGDYIRMTEPSSTASDVTIECWVFPTVTTARGFVVSAGGNSTGAWSISISAANTVEVWADSYSSVKFTTVLTVTDNTWNHLALVKTSGVIKIYVNGVLDAGSYTQSGNFGYPTSTNITLGAYNISLNQLFFGYISNFRYVQGTALYSGSTITVPTSPLTAVSGTQVLTCQSATLIDISTNYFTITVTGDSKPLPFNPFGLTNTTGVSFTPSVNGGSMYFDGTGDYLSSGPNVNYDLSTTNFTVEFWLYPTATGYTGIWGVGSGTYIGVGLQLSNTNTVTVVYGTGSTATFTSGTKVLKLNSWAHLVLSRSGSSTKLYIDGVLESTTTASTFGAGSYTNYIGQGWGISSSQLVLGNPISGYISDFKITRGVSLYNSNFYPPVAPASPTTTVGANTYSSSVLVNGTSGGIIDYHGTNNLETVGDVKLASEYPYAGSYYSADLSGTGDYLNIASNAAFGLGTGDYTIEGWFYPTTNTGEINVTWRIGAINGNNSISGGVAGNSIQFRHTTTTTATSATISILNTWNHVAWVRSSGTVKVYLNGVEVISTSASTSVSTGDCTIGYENTTFRYNGSISNFRIVKGTAVYTGAFTPSTTPLTAISGTSLLTCQSNTFKDNSSNAFTITRGGSTSIKSRNPFQQNTGKSIYFDGTGDYLYSPSTQSLVFSGDFTVECWVYQAAAATQYVLVLGSNTSYPGLRVGMTSTGVLTVAFSTTGSSTTLNLNAGTITTPLNTWVHIAVTRSGTSVKTYTNGTVDQTGTVSGTLYSSAYNYVGAHYTGSTWTYLNGYITDLRITNGYARYTTTFTPPTEPFYTK